MEAGRCAAFAKRSLRGGAAAAQAAQCIAQLKEIDVNLTAQAAHCAALPLPCNGRGNCTEGQCVCMPTWYGTQCETQPTCRYWDVAAKNWSTDGCRMTSLVVGDDPREGRIVCACDHLTEFAVVSNVRSSASDEPSSIRSPHIPPLATSLPTHTCKREEMILSE